MNEFGNFGTQFGIQRITFVAIVRVTQHTSLIHKVTRYHISQLFGTTVHTNIVLVRRSPSTIVFFKPVCVGIGTGIFLPVTISSNSTIRDLPFLVSNDTTHYFLVEHSSLSSVSRCVIEVAGKIVRIHHIRNLDGIRETNVIIVVYCYTAALTRFCCNQDHTERSTRSIDRRCSSILQYRDTFDILRIDGIHISFHTIN